MQKQKRILICPLDWGLGHATRCVPVIRLLLAKKAEVLVAADGGPLALLKQEFPQLTFIPFKGYGISYPKKGSMKMKMLLSVPKIVARIKTEQAELDKLIDRYKIDIVISDNRYGCFSKKVKSIFITHQLMIKAPVGEALLHKKVLSYISNYDECWVPDSAEGKLCGDLAHKYALPANVHMVGALSRFESKSLQAESSKSVQAESSKSVQVESSKSVAESSKLVQAESSKLVQAESSKSVRAASSKSVRAASSKSVRTEYSKSVRAESRTETSSYDLMAIISGPEPQRSILEKLVIDQLKQTNLKALVVCGKTENSKKTTTLKNVTMVSHLGAEEMQDAIGRSKIILSRSGYSTIMDLAVLGKKAIFIATPGQTEQEYLAKLFMKRGIAFSQTQSKFDLKSAMENSKNFSGFKKIELGHELKRRVNSLF